MNLVELDHALRKLRLSDMADVLEARLRHAQSEKQIPIDLISALVADELVRRQDRLLTRRLQQARFPRHRQQGGRGAGHETEGHAGRQPHKPEPEGWRRGNIANLKKLKGAAFDKVYIDYEVVYHTQVLDALDKRWSPARRTKN